MRSVLLSLTMAAVTIAADGAAASPKQNGWMRIITFDELNASKGGVSGQALADYLGKFGVRVSGLSTGTRLEVLDARNLYEGNAVLPLSLENVFTQVGSSRPISFTLTFATPLHSFGFTRPMLLAATSSGITHPGWIAEAFDANGQRLDLAREQLIASYTDVPAAQFVLRGPGIVSVRFSSNSHGFAGFNAVLLDGFILRGGVVRPHDASNKEVVVSSGAMAETFGPPKNGPPKNGPAKDNDQEQVIPIELRGTIKTGVVAVGGETTGIILQTKDGVYELVVPKSLLALVNKLNGKEAIVTGMPVIRQGVELGQRRLLFVVTIVAADTN